MSTRAALYVRLSEETDATTSPERQRDITASYAAARGWDVVGTYEDLDVSATHARLARPALDRLRADIGAGKVDVVIVWRLDRLARKVLDLLTLLDEWRHHDAAVASATEGIDLTTAGGRAMATLIGVFAEMEADAIRERVTAGIDAVRKAGRFSGGTVPFGYTVAPHPDGRGRALVVEGSEADVIRRAASRVLEGERLYRVAADLNRDAVPAPRSAYRRVARSGGDPATADRGTWRVQSLRRLLTGDHIAGRQIHRGEPLRGPDGLPATVWAPIVPPSTLAALRARLEPSTDAPRPRVVRAARLLSGLVWCASCGSKMYVGGTEPYRVYGCPSAKNGVPCASPRISARGLEEHVLAEARRVLGPRRVTATVTERAPSDVEARLAEAEVAIRSTSASLADDAADVPALMARLTVLKETRSRLRAEAEGGAVLSYVVDTGLSWEETLDECEDDDARRRLLEQDLARVEILDRPSRTTRFDPSRVALEWTLDEIAAPS